MRARQRDRERESERERARERESESESERERERCALIKGMHTHVYAPPPLKILEKRCSSGRRLAAPCFFSNIIVERGGTQNRSKVLPGIALGDGSR